MELIKQMNKKTSKNSIGFIGRFEKNKGIFIFKTSR